MIKFIQITLADGSIYMAKTEREIIIQLKLEDWTNYKNLEDYKSNIKRRVEIFNGEQIGYSTDLEFLMELNRIGFIKNIEIF